MSRVWTTGGASTVAIAFVFMMGSSPAAAQSTRALRVLVTDPSGAVLEGATVRVTTEEGILVGQGRTDATGRMEIANLAHTVVTVHVNRDGFADAQMPATLSV